MKKIIYWFRNDLRLHDQPILKEFENRNDVLLLPIFCFDERWFVKHKLGFLKTGSFRAKFLIETVNELKANLQQIGSDLLITYEKPEEIISNITKEFKADEIYAEKEDTSEEIFVEDELRKRLNHPIHFHESKTLLRTNQLPFSINDLPDIFTNFRKKAEPLLNQVKTVEVPETLPPFPDEFRNNQTISLSDLKLDLPTCDERAVMKFIGGENEGLKRLNKFIWEDKSILRYKETRDQLIGENYSSKFSPWLANGSLSARKIFS
ncbi:MAG: deoxyribodipyrimidine photo-lyase, partial [Ignavibacterium sp.]